MLILVITIIKIFWYKGKLWRETEAGGNNGIIENATIAVLLKYLNNICR